jgi:hypothetical protein
MFSRNIVTTSERILLRRMNSVRKSKHLNQFSSNVLGANLDIQLQVSKPFWSLVGKEVARDYHQL